jgi:hypothetical protein
VQADHRLAAAHKGAVERSSLRVDRLGEAVFPS